ncbi:hypothetical protein CPLU01_08560 [Colletotrichum plurivorum]|uniref:Pyridoxamine 5'-phosphate oxidase Alr4036 family FMN-binding domain-containing protein n=1 Tax=Colletotrichum plurivorum TaxID=2175906 RepID=A0A8H6NDB6_9PEZI|nr:hypothetical protein CPLU01_08560 [Colletotrichum plurivorum]
MNPARNISTRLTQLTQHFSPRTMSTTSTSTGPAPWRTSFLKNVTEMSSPEFTLATLHDASAASPSPRLRTVVFRGLWASLPVNPKNTADLNPPSHESDLLTLTTDARMAKVPDLLPPGSSSSVPESGGGALVEACFWTPARVQWRVRGEAYILGRDIDSASAEAVRSKLLERMRKASSSEEVARRTKEDLPAEVKDNVVTGSDWSFAREVTAHFGNLSPAMRGTFRNPEPGAPRASNPPTDELKLGQKVEDLNDPVARSNFRVVVIVPAEVDRTDLSDAEDPRRWLYRFVGAGAEGDEPPADGAERSNGWEMVEVWP